MESSRDDWLEPVTLGRTGLTVGRLGLAAGYGMPAAALERAFERGMNYIYWGSFRRRSFAEGIRNLSRQREKMVLVVQSYSPFGWYLRHNVENALRALRFDYVDVLLLGMWNRPVPRRVLDAVAKLKQAGLIRFLAVSTHNRPLVAKLANELAYDIFHIRYNAVHPGAERDIFPHLPAGNRPGIVSFTATSWRQLLKSRRIPEDEKRPTAGDCYRFVLSNPGINVCLTGAANLEQTEQALAALEQGPMSAEELAWMGRVGRAISKKG